MDWEQRRAHQADEHRARSAEPLVEGAREDLRLAGIAGASWAEGLAALMLGEAPTAETLERRAADEYLASWAVAPRGSWGRPIAALRCRLLGGDEAGLERDATATLAAGSATANGAPAAYATALALLSLRRDHEALPVAQLLRGRDDFVPSVADALAAIAARDGGAYEAALGRVLQSFEERDCFLEDMPVADTVLVLAALAAPRGLGAELPASALLPTPSD